MFCNYVHIYFILFLLSFVLTCFIIMYFVYVFISANKVFAQFSIHFQIECNIKSNVFQICKIENWFFYTFN